MARTLGRFRFSVGLVVALVAGASSEAIADVPLVRILASDGTASDRFGVSVAMSGDTAVIGAPGDGPQGAASGSAYVFVRGALGWVQQAKLTASDGAAGAAFGSAAAISGDTVVVGATNAKIAGTETGAAYVFVRSGTTWSEQAKLSALDFIALDQFASAISASGNTVAIGAFQADPFGQDSGAAYIFTRTGTTWSQQAKIVPIDGRAFDYFGTSVAVNGDTFVGGAPGDDDNAIASGSVYVYVRSGTNWGLQQKIRPADGADRDQFGNAVALGTDTLVVGSPDDDEHGLASGSAYVYARSSGLWSQQAKLVPDDGAPGDFFGAKMSLSGNNVLIGAYLDEVSAPHSGSAYAFQRNGTTWSQVHKYAPAFAADDNFGVAIALDGDQGLAGVEQDDTLGSNAGAAFSLVFATSTVPAAGAYMWFFACALVAIGAFVIRTKPNAAR